MSACPLSAKSGQTHRSKRIQAIRDNATRSVITPLPILSFLSREVSPHERKSKPPGEIALDRMVVRTVGELARIRDADLGLRGELQIAARFDQRGVARNRNTQDIEPRADALERKRRGRRHVAEGMLPGDRHARDERHAGPVWNSRHPPCGRCR